VHPKREILPFKVRRANQFLDRVAKNPVCFDFDSFGRAIPTRSILVQIHQTLCVTPAMEAGIPDHLWSLEEVVGLLE